MINLRPKAALPLLALALLSGCDQPPQVNPKGSPNTISNKCWLDLINGSKEKVFMPKTSNVEFRGWAVDSNTNTTPPQLNLVLTSKNGQAFVFENATRNARPDVVKAFNQNAYLQSGFQITAEVTDLEKGAYRISLQMPVEGGVVTCSTPKILQLK